MTQPLDISVVIPCHNAACHIRAAVDSVLMQRDVAVELVVVDDGSSDESVELLRGYGAALTLITGPNRGAAQARNTGVAASGAPFIKYLDADDYLLPGALAAQLAHARTLPEGGLSYGRMLRLTEETGQISGHSPRDRRADNSDTLTNLVLDPPVTAALLYPRVLIEQIGGFDPQLALRDDFDLFLRALRAGARPMPCPAPIYVYRDHATAGRLSRRQGAADYDLLLGMFRAHHAALGPEQAELARALAPAIWTTARNALRLGHTPQAAALFDLAQSLAPGKAMRGKALYRALVHVLGPIRAERLLARLKGISP